MTQALIQVLATNRLFHDTDPQLLADLAAQAALLQVHAGAHLFYMDEPATAFYMVHVGEICLYRPNYEGSEKVFHMVGEGGLIAETAMFAQPCHYPLSAQAATDAVVYKVDRQALIELTQHSPSLALRLLGNMSARIHQAVNRIDHLTTSNASQRLVLYLIDLSREQRSRQIHFPVTGAALAGQLNIAPETLSRQLNNFKRIGLLDGRNRDWVLIDIESLHKSVGLPVPKKSTIATWHDSDRGSDLFGCCNLH